MVVMASICVIASAEPVSQMKSNVIQSNYIETGEALNIATQSLTEFVGAGSPGVKETKSDVNDWKGVTLDPNPITIYDINGLKLFYQFSVLKKGVQIGQIKTSASKVLESPIITIEVTPLPLNSKTALDGIQKVSNREYPGMQIVSTNFTCYDYPKIGVTGLIKNEKTGELKQLDIDYYDQALLSPSDMVSIYDTIPGNQFSDNINKWTIGSQKYLDNVGNLATANNQILQRSPSKQLSLTLHAQTNDSRCVPAVGQMIAQYYGISKNQDDIATIMGTTSAGTMIGNINYGELRFYKNYAPIGIGKPSSIQDINPTWVELQREINANQPFNSRMRYTPSSGHALATAGYRTDPYGFYQMYVYDPLPVNVGGQRWQTWTTYPGAPLWVEFNVYVWS